MNKPQFSDTYLVEVIMPDGTHRTFKGNVYPYDDEVFNVWLAENGANINWIHKN
jgi:hypothetical protein